jgi:hypothetical protein
MSQLAEYPREVPKALSLLRVDGPVLTPFRRSQQLQASAAQFRRAQQQSPRPSSCRLTSRHSGFGWLTSTPVLPTKSPTRQKVGRRYTPDRYPVSTGHSLDLDGCLS